MSGLLLFDGDTLGDAGHNPVGVGNDAAISPQGRLRQPWAGGCNPVGVDGHGLTDIEV